MIKNVIEYLFKKPIPQTRKIPSHIFGFSLFISLITRKAESNQKNWLNETGWKYVFDRRNAGARINAVAAIIIASLPPFNSFTILAIIITDTLPTMAGKNRKAKVVFPKSQVEIFERTAINGGTEV